MNYLVNNSYYVGQRQVIINRDNVTKGAAKRSYLVAYQDNLIQAMKTLTGTAFRVYLCLLFNKDKYSLEYSPEHISKIAGMCLPSARKAFKELQECGYIEELDKRHYVFYEVPKITLSLKPHEERREFIDNDSGEILKLTYNELSNIVGENAFSMWQGAKIYESTSITE